MLVAIELSPHGDDSWLRPRSGNPQALSHDAETDENPRRCWTFKRLPKTIQKLYTERGATNLSRTP
jgi:hypothetical protein